MAEPIEGIINVTGTHGCGKTSFALGMPVKGPEKIGIYSFDHKPYPKVNPPFGVYKSYLHMLSHLNGDGLADERMVQQVMKDLNLAQGLDSVIMDAWEIFAKALVSYSLAHAHEYKSFGMGGGKILTMSKLGFSSILETSLLDALYTDKGVKTIFVINHLGYEYEEGVRTGRKVPKSSNTLAQKARMILWLQQNPDPHFQCPTAIVLKDPGIHVWDQKMGGMRSMHLLPEKLNPAILPNKKSGENISLWDVIGYYQENPVGDRLLKPEERASEEEYSLISGTLTPDQKAVWERNQEIAKAFGGGYTTELGDRIDDLRQNGVPFTEARQTLINEGLLAKDSSLMDFKKVYSA